MGAYKKAIKPMFPAGKWRILRGDTVKVMTGKDKGQLGTVTKVIRHTQVPRVIVEGRNLNKRFIKRTQDNPGGVVSVESPLHYSNVRLVDPVHGKPVRTRFVYQEDGSKVRQTTGRLASGTIIPRPAVLAERRRPTPLAGPKDTPLAQAQATTYDPAAFPEAWRPLLDQVTLPNRTSRHALTRTAERNRLIAPALRRPFSCHSGALLLPLAARSAASSM